ncbi:MAG: GxxExxY protein [Planctomycetota bacterium]
MLTHDEESLWSQKVIGAAIEVHRVLGPGLLESTYEEALKIELESRGIPFEHQGRFPIVYKGKILKMQRFDIKVANKVTVELKAREKVPEIAKPKTVSYLRFSGCRVGLIINFHKPTLVEGVDRVAL